MACDPGGVSGCATGIFNLSAKSVKLAMRRSVFKGTLNAWEEHGSSEVQSLSIVEKWLDFVAYAAGDLQITPDRIMFVMESFQLRKRNVELSPVEIISGIKTLIYATTREMDEALRKNTDHGRKVDLTLTQVLQPTFQTPGAAKSFATNQRLREWGAWQVGSEHKRDAVRHLGSALNHLLD